MIEQDMSHLLQQQVEQAFVQHSALQICGNGSKDFYGFPLSGERLDCTVHRGIVSYDPTELVLTARAGTSLEEIDAALAQHGQMLSCEAPHFGTASFGGMIAAGLSGPRRPYGGSIADLLLGCQVLNGRGEILNFGGKVMKNVAGYDVSRLMAGSLGCLGIILQATVKVVPRPKAERTFRFALEKFAMTALVNQLRASGFPLSACCHNGEHLVLRFSAGVKEIDDLDSSLHKHFPGLEIEPEAAPDFWQDLREQRSVFFQRPGDLWRLSLPPSAPDPQLEGDSISEWHGALRWLKTTAPHSQVFEHTEALNGSATLFKRSQSSLPDSIFQPLPEALFDWHKQLKQAFDPAGILNPGRMYRTL